MNRRQLERHLRAHGCILYHHGGRHDVWLNPANLAKSPVPMHPHVKRGTVRSICRILRNSAASRLLTGRRQNRRNRYRLTWPLADLGNNMWCRHCAQDVPGVPSLEQGRYSCARCSEPLAPISASATAHARDEEIRRSERKEHGVAIGLTRQPPAYDGWAIEEQLRHAFRVLGPSRTATSSLEEPAAGRKLRVDATHGAPAPHASKKTRRSLRRVDRVRAAETLQAPASSGGKLLGFFVWSMLVLGTMAFGCGLALLGWSSYAGRQDLWTIGTPVVLAAQIALVLGLTLQLDRIWRDNRRAAAKLMTVDRQIHDLKATTSLLGTTHGPSAAFYAHWAGGAGPDILLSDLKSQLDLLAVKLSNE